MTRIIYDHVLREKLPNLETPIELCDEEGHVLARIRPVYDPVLYPQFQPQISKEELQRRKSYQGRTYTTAEVLAYLESL
jgi:hypothetical protein